MIIFSILFVSIISLMTGSIAVTTTIVPSSDHCLGQFDNIIVSSSSIITGTEGRDKITVFDLDPDKPRRHFVFGFEGADCLLGTERSWIFGAEGVDYCEGQKNKLFSCELGDEPK